jgi:hypothetical protein
MGGLWHCFTHITTTYINQLSTNSSINYLLYQLFYHYNYLLLFYPPVVGHFPRESHGFPQARAVGECFAARWNPVADLEGRPPGL